MVARRSSNPRADGHGGFSHASQGHLLVIGLRISCTLADERRAVCGPALRGACGLSCIMAVAASRMRAVWSADAVTIQPCRRKFDWRLDTSQRPTPWLGISDSNFDVQSEKSSL
jgi:hypothetical protein